MKGLRCLKNDRDGTGKTDKHGNKTRTDSRKAKVFEELHGRHFACRDQRDRVALLREDFRSVWHAIQPARSSVPMT